MPVAAARTHELPTLELRIPRAVFLQFQTLIHEESGIWLGEHKKALLTGRLGRRLRELGVKSFESYYRLATENAEERTILLNLITTNETRFFRDPQQFRHLEQVIVPLWKQEAEIGNRAPTVNVWSAGCSTGEEPFSIAMALREHFPVESRWHLRILGTDISTRVLEKCRQATWPIDRAKEIPLPWLKRYMLRGTGAQEGWMRARPEIESLLQFEYLNLNSASFNLEIKFDLIFCRNVLMYFSPATKTRVLEKLFAHLAPGGRLFLSPAESAAGQRLGQAVFPGVYQACPDPAREGAGEGTL